MQIMQGDLPVDGPTEVKPRLLSISRSSINGSLAAPSSKSQVQRLVALGVLTRGQTVIEGVTACDDVRSAVAVAEGMGAWEPLACESVLRWSRRSINITSRP